MAKKYTAIDLFCGCGGLSQGFLKAGFNVPLGIDVNEDALRTFSYNHKGSFGMNLDLFNPNNVEQIKTFLEKKHISLDVLIGGPPCQGFSLAGPRKIDDSRNVLYHSMVKTSQILKPKAIVLENVPGMIQLHGGLVAKHIINDFEKLGYKTSYKILYAPDYGVPQIRKRVFFVGLYGAKSDFAFPKPILTPENYITCGQAIDDLPELVDIYGEEVQDYEKKANSQYEKDRRKGSKRIYNHIGTIHDKKTIKFLKMVPEGKNYKALPKQYEGIYKYHEALTRYDRKKPSPTINTGHRSHFHYRLNRIPTVRENARLQSFDDTFIFFGNKSEQYRQVGNAVPPLLGYALAKELIKWLDCEEK